MSDLRAVDSRALTSSRKIATCGIVGERRYCGRLLPAEGKVSTRESAAAFMAQHSGVNMKEILFSDTARATAYRKAARKLHPDTDGGNSEEFVKLAEANKVLSATA